MDGMVFDAGTWWLITICVTALITLIGALVSRSVFKQLDKNGADIKEVRENYTPRSSHEKDMETLRTIHQKGMDTLRTAHQKDMEILRQEVKEVRTEMKTEIQTLSDDIKEVKEKCLQKTDFERSVLQLENKVDTLTRYLMERRT